MSTYAVGIPAEETPAATALEFGFPSIEISRVAEQESWRKEINRPLYHIHKWWATRLGSVFRAIVLAALSLPDAPIWETFYDRHRLSDKIILDPFMGSGTTIGEAVKLGAKAIGCDINPVSTFLVRQALARVPEATLRTEFDKLDQAIAPRIRHYYQTRDPLSGRPIPVLYYFWVKTVEAPNGESLPLFDRYVFAQDAYPNTKPLGRIVCPQCWNVLEGRHDATDFQCTHCRHRFNPQVGPASGQHVVTNDGKRYRIKDLLPAGIAPQHRLYALLALRPNGEKVYLPATADDIALYQQAEAQLGAQDLPLPTLAVRLGHNTDQARGYNYLRWRDFFNARQLLCLGLLLQAILRIEDMAVQEQMLCLFSSLLEFNNLFCSYKGEGTGAVRHMFSNHILKPERTPLENSVWGTDRSSGTFCSLFESRLIRAKEYLDEPFEVGVTTDLFGGFKASGKIVASDPIDVCQFSSWGELTSTDRGVLILNGDSGRLPIPDGAVDAVITDPPYFDFIHYSELSDFFFAWLSPVLKNRYPWFDRPDSSHPGEVQHEDPKVFAHQLSQVFAESHRVLKDDGVLAFSFHHSRVEGWAAIYQAITAAGFAVVAAHPVHAELRAASPKTATKEPISLDAILVCRKRGNRAIRSYQPDSPRSRTDRLAGQLRAAGLRLSKSDLFVIGASQTLVAASAEGLPAEHIEQSLEVLRKDFHHV